MDHPATHIRLLPALFGLLLLVGCETDGPSVAPSSGAAMLEAEVFQDDWAGSGGTLLIRSLDGESVWRNRIEIGPGRHEVLFEFEVTAACDPASGCAIRTYEDRIAFEAEADRGYRMKAEIEEDGTLRVAIVDLDDGETVASMRTREAVLEQEGYPDEAWAGLCRDADRGDAKARRAIGLHYWRGWWPAERDVVLAYQWLTLAAQANDSAADSFRQELLREMTGEQIGEAERRVAGWEPGICTSEAKLR